MLDGVPYLVRGDRVRGDAGAAKVACREAHDPLAGVVMIGQLTWHLHDGDVSEAIGVEDGPGCLGAGDAGSRGHLLPATVGTA